MTRAVDARTGLERQPAQTQRVFRTLASVQELSLHLHDRNWVVVDCRHDPFDFEAGYRAYIHAHIPNAIFAHLARDLSGAAGRATGRHPLPDPQRFIQSLARWGIDSETQIVAYDDSGSSYAARFWWMCRWVGLQRVAVLDGGWAQWRRHLAPISRRIETPRPPAAALGACPDDKLWVDVETVAACAGRRDTCLIDARPGERFRGEIELQDPLAGHIPGAINRHYRDNLDPEGCFLPAMTLRSQFLRLIGGVPPRNVIHQCGAGVTACNNLLAMEIAGLPGSRLYPGSWSEWCALGDRPYRTGAAAHP